MLALVPTDRAWAQSREDRVKEQPRDRQVKDQTRSEQGKTDDAVQAVERAHEKALGDKAYAKALEKRDLREVESILIRNGAPENISVKIPKESHGFELRKIKIRISVVLAKPPRIDILITF
jgi:hypothetical protein